MSKVALITGCSDAGGLGAALCRTLKEENFRVIASMRNTRNAPSAQALADLGIDVLELDISSSESIERAATYIREQAGRLDVLINNASAATRGPVLDTDPAIFRTVLETNVIGLFSLIQTLAPLMIETSRRFESRTAMVNIGSVASTFGMPWHGAYCASKVRPLSSPQ